LQIYNLKSSNLHRSQTGMFEEIQVERCLAPFYTTPEGYNNMLRFEN